MTAITLKVIIESILMASSTPVSIARMLALFETEPLPDGSVPERKQVVAVLDTLAQDCQSRGVDLVEVASGYRFQASSHLLPWVSRLWDERPPRYSRALLETLALIAYRQPVTRGDIEDVRGVAVSSGIIKTLLERGWVKVVGYRNVPGRPALFSTTPEFLDYFCLASLDQLPPLADVQALGESVRKNEEQAEPSLNTADVLDLDEEHDRGDVLAATAAELQQADELVAQVEANLYGSPDESERPRSLGDIVERLSEAHLSEVPTNSDTNYHASTVDGRSGEASKSEKE